MESLVINSTVQTPQIILNGETGVFSITGKSYPENVNDFYLPVFEYIEIYKSKPAGKTILDFEWLYYNTATAKIIIKIILALKNVSKDFEVRWYCKKDFDIIMEKGLEIKEVLNVNLKIISI